MKTKRYLLFILLPLLALNCKKEETHKLETVDGYVLDISNNDSLPDVKIRFRTMSVRGASHRLSKFDVLLDSTTTDSSGFFSFTFLRTDDRNYAFEPIINNYYWNPSMTVTYVIPNVGFKHIVQPIPLTYLKINIKNNESGSSSDSIYYWGPSDRSSQYVDNWWYPSGYKHEFAQVGNNVDTTFYVTLQYQEVPLQYWDVTKNGTTIRNAAYIGCNPLDTCFFEIKY